MAELTAGPGAGNPGTAVTASTAVDLEVLEEIQRRVLWLAVRMVDAANHERSTGDGVKVGGHQASSASLVTAMTALWFAHLSAEDRVSVKPHASPVFHAIQYLLGNLDRKYLTTLRCPRRPAGVPVADQGPGRCRLLDRVGRPRRGRAAVRRRGPALRRRALR